MCVCVCVWVLDYNSCFSVSLQNKGGETPLDVAKKYTQFKCVSLLGGTGNPDQPALPPPHSSLSLLLSGSQTSWRLRKVHQRR